MAKRKQPAPEPTRSQKEEFIRSVGGDIDFSRYKSEKSIDRLYGYARGVLKSGEPFDLARGTGHPPKIQHHDYGTERMQRLPPQKYRRYSMPMLDDWYIGSCEHPPNLSDVKRLMKHDGNAGKEFLYIGLVGIYEFEGQVREDFAMSILTDRKSLEDAIKKSHNLVELAKLLKPESNSWIRICILSMRPAIERGGLAKKQPPKPKKPRLKLIEPASPGKKAKYRYIPEKKE